MLFLPVSSPVLLHVDARDAARGIFSVREDLPAAGPLILKVAQWIPGEHGPSGKTFDFVDIHFTENGKPLEWHHDPLDLFTIRVVAEPGTVEARFEYVAPRRDAASRNLARIKWNRLALLPDGKASTEFSPTVELPPKWSIATPLDWGHPGRLDTVTAERLVDSPAVIGAHYRSYSIDQPGLPPARLEVFTEKEAELPAPVVEDHKRLLRQAVGFFGGPHFRHYQFLLTFSDNGGAEGLEHNECSEDGLGKDAFTNRVAIMDLDAHEFSHAWCGKYMRPKGLSNLDFDAPMNDEDLWIYEGFTQFAGIVLSHRCGASSDDVFRDQIASLLCAEDFETTGRSWRTVEDTAVFGSLINTYPDAWSSRRRNSDYYNEMVCVYAEADATIRRATDGGRCIDDVAHAFFAGPNNGPEIRPYGRDDFYAAFNSVLPYDWRGFFDARVMRVRPRLNDGWLEESGWRLVSDDYPNAFEEGTVGPTVKWSDQLRSVGLLINDGEVRDVLEGSPADRAKMAPGMKLLAVDGAAYSLAALNAALKESTSRQEPMEFVVDDYDVIRTIPIDYHGGLRVPHLERVSGKPDLLSALSAPKT